MIATFWFGILSLVAFWLIASVKTGKSLFDK